MVLLFVIERYHARHLMDVMKLAVRTLPEEYPAAFFVQLAGAQGRHFRVARDTATGHVIGFIVAAREPGLQANLLLFAVDPAYQGHGIGRALLRDVQRTLTLDDIRSVRLEVRMDNARAIDFYRREGFSVVGLQSGVYRDGGDALSMSKPLF